MLRGNQPVSLCGYLVFKALTVLLAKLNDTLNASVNGNEIDVSEFVQDAKIDLDVWFMYVSPRS